MYAGQSRGSSTTQRIVDFAVFESQNEERNNLFNELREVMLFSGSSEM